MTEHSGTRSGAARGGEAPGQAATRTQPATSAARILPSADVDARARIGAGSTVWHLAQVREDAVLGQECVVGRGAYVGPDVHIGDRVKLQNHALVYEPARLEDGVFIGPAAVLTNDPYPRATGPDGQVKRAADWEAHGVVVCAGAAVGARAVVVAGVRLGRWSMVAAGAVVTRDVGEYALVAGVPARWLRWVGRAGVPLEPVGHSPEEHGPDGNGSEHPGEVRWRCPRTGAEYLERDGTLSPVGQAEPEAQPASAEQEERAVP